MYETVGAGEKVNPKESWMGKAVRKLLSCNLIKSIIKEKTEDALHGWWCCSQSLGSLNKSPFSGVGTSPQSPLEQNGSCHSCDYLPELGGETLRLKTYTLVSRPRE